jgi:hypothetical protein
MNELSSDAAKELSKLGAAKGGRARASVLTALERKTIAKNAIAARWAKYKEETFPPPVNAKPDAAPNEALPFSMFRGTLKIGDMDVEAHVLNDERRVLTQREVVRVLSAGRDSGNLQVYLQSKVFADNPFDLGAMIQFRVPGTQFLANGYEATVLIELCERYLEARNAGILRGKQKDLASQAEIIMRACAKIGIIALIDEATGYQQVRKKRALQLKFQAFIAEDMQEWAVMFKPDFWYELARLEGVHYSPRNRPIRWGKYIIAFVYDAIDKDVSRALKVAIPDPHYQQNLHQMLTDWGRQQVHDQIERVVTIMKLCDNMDDFREKFAKVFKKTSVSSQLNFNWETEQ